jgi:hypothetical protein
MGYTTDFSGKFTLTPAATKEQAKYLNSLANTRRMKRDVKKLYELHKGKHGLPQFDLPENIKNLIQQLADNGAVVSNVRMIEDKRTPEEIYGVLGQYYVNEDNDSSTILDFNSASGESGYKPILSEKDPNGQPSLYCQWIVTDNGETLEWDGVEKFYCYVEWLNYLINHFFNKWGIMLNGDVFWEGEESGDLGKIEIRNNVVTTKNATITY